ncbi:MAG: squalene/phytoene synthase family protein [Phycisphaerales bacterium]
MTAPTPPSDQPAAPTPRSQAIRDLHLLAPHTPHAPDTPDTPADNNPPPTLEHARAYCHTLARAHRENFHVLTRFVPARLRDDFAAVYAFCRWSDDLADETGHTDDARQRSLELLTLWRAHLTTAIDHAHDPHNTPAPTHPVMRALAHTISDHHLDPIPFHHLIDAFEQDQRLRHYHTWDQLIDYSNKSANPVGRIVLALAAHDPCDPRNAAIAEQSDAICTALQLTNFWQDVRRDLLERDRVYLPSQDTGITPDDLRAWADTPNDPDARIRYIKALRPLVHRTRDLYQRGRGLPKALDPSIAPVIALFIAGGQATLNAVERSGCTTLWRRPSLGNIPRTFLIAKALLARYM